VETIVGINAARAAPNRCREIHPCAPKDDGRPVNILHRLTFARGSEALDFVRTLRELTEAQLRGEVAGVGPVLVYGARILAPDAPAELYASVGALTLAHALGMQDVATPRGALPVPPELPADMALLFFTPAVPDESVLRGS